jgi:hypothetical protein
MRGWLALYGWRTELAALKLHFLAYTLTDFVGQIIVGFVMKITNFLYLVNLL